MKRWFKAISAAWNNLFRKHVEQQQMVCDNLFVIHAQLTKHEEELKSLARRVSVAEERIQKNED